MRLSEIKQTIKEVLVQQLGVTEEEIQPNSTSEELGADSLDKIEIIMEIEERFGIKISDEEAERNDKFMDMVLLVDSKTFSPTNSKPTGANNIAIRTTDLTKGQYINTKLLKNYRITELANGNALLYRRVKFLGIPLWWGEISTERSVEELVKLRNNLLDTDYKHAVDKYPKVINEPYKEKV